MPPDNDQSVNGGTPTYDLPFQSGIGSGKEHALELRTEILRSLSAGDEWRRGESDSLHIGSAFEQQSSDVVGGEEKVRVRGSLTEEVHGSRTNIAKNHVTEIHGKLTLDCHGDTALLGGGMSETHLGAELLLAGMSDDLIVGAGVRTTLPADLWVCGLIGMEEKPVTAAADGVFIEVSGLHMEREYSTGTHVATGVVFSGALFTTTASGFRPLMKVLHGVRNMTPDGGGGGGGGGGSSSPPPAPPPAGEPPVGSLLMGARGTRLLATSDDMTGLIDTAGDLARTTENLDDARRLSDALGVLEDLHTLEHAAEAGDETTSSAVLRRLQSVAGENPYEDLDEVRAEVLRRIQDPDDPYESLDEVRRLINDPDFMRGPTGDGPLPPGDGRRIQIIDDDGNIRWEAADGSSWDDPDWLRQLGGPDQRRDPPPPPDRPLPPPPPPPTPDRPPGQRGLDGVDGGDGGDYWNDLIRTREQADIDLQHPGRRDGSNPTGLHAAAQEHMQTRYIEMRDHMELLVAPYADELGVSLDDLSNMDRSYRSRSGTNVLEQQFQLRNLYLQAIDLAEQSGDTARAEVMRATLANFDRLWRGQIRDAIEHAAVLSRFEGAALAPHLDQPRLIEQVDATLTNLQTRWEASMSGMSPEDAAARGIELMTQEEMQEAAIRVDMLEKAKANLEQGLSPLPYILETKIRALRTGENGGGSIHDDMHRLILGMMEDPDNFAFPPRGVEPGEEGRMIARRDELFAAGDFMGAMEIQRQLDDLRGVAPPMPDDVLLPSPLLTLGDQGGAGSGWPHRLLGEDPYAVVDDLRPGADKVDAVDDDLGDVRIMESIYETIPGAGGRPPPGADEGLSQDNLRHLEIDSGQVALEDASGSGEPIYAVVNKGRSGSGDTIYDLLRNTDDTMSNDPTYGRFGEADAGGADSYGFDNPISGRVEQPGGIDPVYDRVGLEEPIYSFAGGDSVDGLNDLRVPEVSGWSSPTRPGRAQPDVSSSGAVWRDYVDATMEAQRLEIMRAAGEEPAEIHRTIRTVPLDQARADGVVIPDGPLLTLDGNVVVTHGSAHRANQTGVTQGLPVFTVTQETKDAVENGLVAFKVFDQNGRQLPPSQYVLRVDPTAPQDVLVGSNAPLPRPEDVYKPPGVSNPLEIQRSIQTVPLNRVKEEGIKMPKGSILTLDGDVVVQNGKARRSSKKGLPVFLVTPETKAALDNGTAVLNVLDQNGRRLPPGQFIVKVDPSAPADNLDALKWMDDFGEAPVEERIYDSPTPRDPTGHRDQQPRPHDPNRKGYNVGNRYIRTVTVEDLRQQGIEPPPEGFMMLDGRVVMDPKTDLPVPANRQLVFLDDPETVQALENGWEVRRVVDQRGIELPANQFVVRRDPAIPWEIPQQDLNIDNYRNLVQQRRQSQQGTGQVFVGGRPLPDPDRPRIPSPGEPGFEQWWEEKFYVRAGVDNLALKPGGKALPPDETRTGPRKFMRSNLKKVDPSTVDAPLPPEGTYFVVDGMPVMLDGRYVLVDDAGLPIIPIAPEMQELIDSGRVVHTVRGDGVGIFNPGEFTVRYDSSLSMEPRQVEFDIDEMRRWVATRGQSTREINVTGWRYMEALIADMAESGDDAGAILDGLAEGHRVGSGDPVVDLDRTARLPLPGEISFDGPGSRFLGSGADGTSNTLAPTDLIRPRGELPAVDGNIMELDQNRIYAVLEEPAEAGGESRIYHELENPAGERIYHELDNPAQTAEGERIYAVLEEPTYAVVSYTEPEMGAARIDVTPGEYTDPLTRNTPSEYIDPLTRTNPGEYLDPQSRRRTRAPSPELEGYRQDSPFDPYSGPRADRDPDAPSLEDLENFRRDHPAPDGPAPDPPPSPDGRDNIYSNPVPKDKRLRRPPPRNRGYDDIGDLDPVDPLGGTPGGGPPVPDPYSTPVGALQGPGQGTPRITVTGEFPPLSRYEMDVGPRMFKFEFPDQNPYSTVFGSDKTGKTKFNWQNPPMAGGDIRGGGKIDGANWRGGGVLKNKRRKKRVLTEGVTFSKDLTAVRVEEGFEGWWGDVFRQTGIDVEGPHRDLEVNVPGPDARRRELHPNKLRLQDGDLPPVEEGLTRQWTVPEGWVMTDQLRRLTNIGQTDLNDGFYDAYHITRLANQELDVLARQLSPGLAPLLEGTMAPDELRRLLESGSIEEIRAAMVNAAEASTNPERAAELMSLVDSIDTVSYRILSQAEQDAILARNPDFYRYTTWHQDGYLRASDEVRNQFIDLLREEQQVLRDLGQGDKADLYSDVIRQVQIGNDPVRRLDEQLRHDTYLRQSGIDPNAPVDIRRQTRLEVKSIMDQLNLTDGYISPGFRPDDHPVSQNPGFIRRVDRKMKRTKPPKLTREQLGDELWQFLRQHRFRKSKVV